MQVKKQQLELDMEKWTGSKLGKALILGKDEMVGWHHQRDGHEFE